MKHAIRSISLVLIGAWVLAACTAQATQFSPEMSTAIAGTVNARQATQAAQPTSTPLPTLEQPTAQDPLATFTAIPTLAATQGPTATSAPELTIGSWSDISVPAGSEFKAREAFTKTWSLTNGGTAAWLKDYTIVQISGDNMGVSSQPLGVDVAPGQTVNVTMDMTAPETTGTKTAYYMIRTPNGYTFGGGLNAGRPFYVQIVVKDFFAVTGATVKYSVPSPAAACPVDIKLTAEVSANGAGNVVYYFKTSQGNSDAFSMTFSDSGKQTGSAVKFTVNNPADLTVSIYIESPNHQEFSSVTIPAPCTP